MKTLLFVGALAAPVVLYAQSNPATTLDPVIVTATGQATPITETLAPLLMLSREDIERAQANDLAELLRFFAGVELGRNGGPGATTSVFIRGGESNHTLVLIDGVRVNPATSGGAALQNIAPQSIERIELIKGPRASLYGSDAIGGVINVITRQPASGSTGELNLRGGSQQTWDGGVSAGYAGDRGSASLQVQHFTTDGFPALAGFSQDTGYDRTSINASGRIKAGTATLGAQFWDASGEAEYYGYDPVDFSRVVVAQDYRNQVAAIDAALPLSASVDGSLRVSRMQDDIEQRQNEDFVETVRNAVDGAMVWRGQGQRVTLGASAIREQVRASSFGSAIREDRDILSLRLQDELSHGKHRAVVGASWSDYDGFGDRWDGSFDYGYDLTDSTRLVAAAGTGFRAPDATDRFGFGGNADLKPESARNYELGWQQRIGDRQRLDLRLFQSDVDDLINVLCDENFNCTAVNVDRYRNQGVELTYTLHATDWTATLTGLLQDPQDRSTDTQLLRRAKRTAGLKLNRQFGAWYAGIDVLGSSERPDFGGATLGGYTLVNLSAGVQLHPKADLRLRVENLLDKDYQTAAGFNQPDATFYLGIGYRL